MQIDTCAGQQLVARANSLLEHHELAEAGTGDPGLQSRDAAGKNLRGLQAHPEHADETVDADADAACFQTTREPKSGLKLHAGAARHQLPGIYHCPLLRPLLLNAASEYTWACFDLRAGNGIMALVREHPRAWDDCGQTR